MLGSDAAADDDAYFMEGETCLDKCMIEAPVNTAFFIMNKSQNDPTCLRLKNCVLDGLDCCKRFFCFQV